MLFSYAIVCSFITAKKVTKGLYAKISLIVYSIIDGKNDIDFFEVADKKSAQCELCG